MRLLCFRGADVTVAMNEGGHLPHLDEKEQAECEDRKTSELFLESKEVISICSTGFFRKSFLLLCPRFLLSDIKLPKSTY